MTVFSNLSNLTFNNEEARDNEDLVIVNPYISPDIAFVHGVQTGVNMDTFIPILGQMAEIGEADPGSCGVNLVEDGFAVSQKTWEPKLISARLPLCVDDLPAKMKFWMESQIAANRWEDISDPAKQYVLDVAAKAQQRAIIRHADFGDKDAALVADGGQMTAGTNLGLFTVIDGMWKQIFTDQAGAALAHKVSIDENAAATKVAQLALGTDTAYNTFVGLVTGIAPEAEDGVLVIQCTKSLMDNWIQYVENKSGAYRPELLEDGNTKASFRGYKIEVRKDWDRLIKQYHDLGATYYLPHRAILADINNIPIGTRDTESFELIKSFYDQKDKKVYVDLAWSEDMKILIEEYIAVAY